jgi:hypothetical protein
MNRGGTGFLPILGLTVALVSACGGSGNAAGTPSPPLVQDLPTMPGFDAFQQHNRDVINAYRGSHGIPSWVLDDQLAAFALLGTEEETQDHSPHAHFLSTVNDGSIWDDGFNTEAAENQGDPGGWTPLATDPTQNEMDQIDATLQAMFDEGPGDGETHGHYTNMMGSDYARLGVGLVEVDGRLYLTNDFSD